MGQANIVNVGVDTLVLNAFYLDERGLPALSIPRSFSTGADVRQVLSSSC